MKRLGRFLAALGVIGVLGALAPATANADEMDTHNCEFIILYTNCPDADPDWFWACTTTSGTLEIHNECDLFVREA